MNEIDNKEALLKLTMPKSVSADIVRLSGVLSGKIKPEDLRDDNSLAYLLERDR